MKLKEKIFGILFLLTGIFALLGGLYTWGDGNVFDQNELAKILIPLADIIVTTPISIAAGYGLIKNRRWGGKLALMASGIYIFGSVMVFISIIWNSNYDLLLIVPAISGMFIGLVYSYSKLMN